MDLALSADPLDDALPDNLAFDAEAVPITVMEKWQGAVTPSSGFVAVPMSLLRLQTHLKLSPTEMMVLINLLAHWWDPDRAVFPRTTTIAQRMGVTTRTVQRATQKMMKRGLVEREFKDGRRTFQFTQLAERLARMIGTSLSIKEGF